MRPTVPEPSRDRLDAHPMKCKRFGADAATVPPPCKWPNCTCPVDLVYTTKISIPRRR